MILNIPIAVVQMFPHETPYFSFLIKLAWNSPENRLKCFNDVQYYGSDYYQYDILIIISNAWVFLNSYSL